MIEKLSCKPLRGNAASWGLAATLLVAVLMALLLISTPRASAAGDTIRVLADRMEVSFPGDVMFKLEVEGEEDIVGVTLFYRVLPSGIWTYAYPQVTPSRRVETSLNLDIAGLSYLPPGTELEYYYAIRDSLGGVIETSRERFVYVDDRFQWESTQAGPLTLYWHDQSESYLENVASRAKNSLADIAELLQVEPDNPLRGVIYNSRSEAQEAFPYQSDTITEQGIFQGFAFPAEGVFIGVGVEVNLIVHEGAHLLLEEAASSPTARVPSWVNEGFATYVEPSVYDYRQGFEGGADPSRMPLRHMSTVPGNIQDIRYFYRKSRSTVGYLLETYGTDKFREFLVELDHGRHHNIALNATYGFDLDGLDQKWSSSLSHQSNGDSEGSSNEPSHPINDDSGGVSVPSFVYLDSLLIAFLALLAVAAVIGGFVVRRIGRQTVDGQDEDGLTEEEWEARP